VESPSDHYWSVIPCGLFPSCGDRGGLTFLQMQELHLQIWRNEEAGDWSVVINSLRYEHITSQILEDLVECAVIVAENSLIGPTLVGSDTSPAAPQEIVQEETEGRIRGLVQSNDDLATALERLLESHNQLLAGKPVKNVDELWAQGKAALTKAASAKNVS
jgi:hypothetical protein